MSANPGSIIIQTNARLWQAVTAVRMDRNPATMAELYDARNARQRQRAPMPVTMRAALSRETERQRRAWGRVEEPHRLAAIIGL